MQNFIITLGVFLFFVIWTLIEQKQLVIKKYDITSKELPASFHNTSFVVLADLHNHTFGKHNEKLVQRIDKLNPEFIILAGDMITKRIPCYPSNAYVLLEQLSKRYKIYYAYGNHEQKIEWILKESMENRNGQRGEMTEAEEECIDITWNEYKKRVSLLGVTFLDNESVNMSKGKESIRITGLSIGKEFFERGNFPVMEMEYPDSLIGRKPQDQYQILIAHNPIHFKQYANWGANLTIAGHMHGGLARIPGIGGVISPQVKFFPKFTGGKYTENEKVMIVSRGLGTHSSMPRYFNVPEIVSITLKSMDK